MVRSEMTGSELVIVPMGLENARSLQLEIEGAFRVDAFQREPLPRDCVTVLPTSDPDVSRGATTHSGKIAGDLFGRTPPLLHEEKGVFPLAPWWVERLLDDTKILGGLATSQRRPAQTRAVGIRVHSAQRLAARCSARSTGAKERR
jgi:hypothetical protein